MTLVEWLALHPEMVHTNTPLEVLAAHMTNSLALFESTLIARAQHDFFKPGYTDAPNSPRPAAAAAGPFANGGDALPDGGADPACRFCPDD